MRLLTILAMTRYKYPREDRRGCLCDMFDVPSDTWMAHAVTIRGEERNNWDLGTFPEYEAPHPDRCS